jgi:hypothetical protein
MSMSKASVRMFGRTPRPRACGTNGKLRVVEGVQRC